jgi:alpha-beta hydrolase superfamily lysophospholipase
MPAARLRQFAMLMALACFAGLSVAECFAAEDPFTVLRAGYAERNAARAASAYGSNALYVELYPGQAPVIRSGQAAIESGFRELFAALAPANAEVALDLNFRRVSSVAREGVVDETGFYRLRVLDRSDKQSQVFYGSFAVRIVDGRFAFDSSGPADMGQFEGAAGPVMFAPDDEALERAYYDRLTGEYVDDRGCAVLVTRSSRRLFAFDECARTWRAMQRLEGLRWEFGETVLAAKATARAEFEPASADSSAGSLSDPDRLLIRFNQRDASERRLQRRASFVRRPVRFETAQGLTLAGEIYEPLGATPARGRPAYVVLHGSGPQDRNGYASYVSLLASQLARAGAVALAFDKRGTGESQGSWESASFVDLAQDARAALERLRMEPGVDPERIGFIGSSQAGWVAAHAVAANANANRVILIGAAGAAVSVEEQNVFNTEARMRCAGWARPHIALAINQQRAFFAARRDVSAAEKLLLATQQARVVPGLADWLFPETIDRGARAEWYDVLDADFDPTTVWRDYRGTARFLFAAVDDSTPTRQAVERLVALRTAGEFAGGDLDWRTLRGAQHLGLEAKSLCTSDLESVTRFHRDFWPTVMRWALG